MGWTAVSFFNERAKNTPRLKRRSHRCWFIGYLTLTVYRFSDINRLSVI